PDRRTGNDVERPVHAEVEARVRDRGGEEEERRRRSRRERREHGGAGEAHRRVPRRKRRRAWDRDERVEAARAVGADRRLERVGDPLRGRVGEEDEHERTRVAASEREGEAEREPHAAPAAATRQPFEDVVERTPPVLDDPALDVPVQRGASCLARSTSACRSNGLPTNPWAPRFAACCSACSSTLPLNITTGKAPTP